MANGKYVAPKDVYEYIVKISGVDITELVDTCEIYQDIFNPVWSGNLAMSDTENLLMLLPISIGDKVEITLETRPPPGHPCTGKKKFIFFVSKIDDKEIVKERHYVYNLQLITKEFFKNEKLRVSEHFQGGPASIASSIISGYGMGSLEISNANYNYDIIIPNMSPFVAVEYMATMAKAQGGADFAFFQKDIGGVFAFKSMEEMFKDDSGIELVQENPNYREDRESGNDKKNSYRTIQNMKFLGNIDSINNFAMGFFGSKIIKHDIINKKITDSKYNYGQDNPTDKILKPFKGSIFEDCEESNVSYLPVHSGIVQSMNPNENAEMWKPSRKSNVMKFETNRAVIEIPGHACLYKTIGKMIKIKMPSQETIENVGQDKYLKGEYLVTAIRHTVKNKSYTIVMEIAKKRLKKVLE